MDRWDVLLIAGGLLLVAGVALMWLPAGLVVAGLLLMRFAILGAAAPLEADR